MNAAYKIPKWEDEGPAVLHGSKLYEASTPKRILAHLWRAHDRWWVKVERPVRPVRSFAKMTEAMRYAERATLGGPKTQKQAAAQALDMGAP